MKKRLEYRDEKSHKFWTITVTGKAFTTAYGKVGTDGQSKTKTFDSEEKALKEAEKLVAQKTKKGYADLGQKEVFAKFKIIPFGKLKELVSQDLLAEINANEFGLEDVTPTAFYDGDLEIDDNFNLPDFCYKKFNEDDNIANSPEFRNSRLRYTSIQLIWIAGNLSVSKSIYANETENYSELLFVEKNVKAKNIIQGGFNLYFLGKTTVTQIFYTQIAAEGTYFFKGGQDTKIKVDNNFFWELNGEGVIEIDEKTPLKTLKKIFAKPLDYFVHQKEDGEDFYYFEMDESRKLVKDLIAGKKIFN